MDRPLIKVLIAGMYFGSGLFKVVTAQWSSGEVLYHTLQGMWAKRLAFLMVQMDLPRGVYDVITVGTILFELYMPFLLFGPRRRIFGFVVGLGFHTTIGLQLGFWESWSFRPATRSSWSRKLSGTASIARSSG